MFQVFKLIKPIITNTGPKINKNIKIGNKIKSQKIIENLEINSFGKKNKNKIFYVIKRSPGSGFFSNFAYTLNHLNISKIFNFVPIIDMKNYKTIYNDKFSLINKNAWNYYFKNLNKHKLEDVYKSQNVVFSCS